MNVNARKKSYFMNFMNLRRITKAEVIGVPAFCYGNKIREEKHS